MVKSTTELNLSVPTEQSRRINLMDTARQTVKLSQIIPPVSIETLEQLAHQVLAQTNGTSEELAFTMLMISNELWRPYVEATPFNRRLLLMPQCLKNSSSCSAMIDELGLICAGCNQCSINSFLNEAENLGYATLVAEGTSSALALVEEGSVDAILGVSCMETLQKSFKQVVTSVIPSIAIPLLNDGCTNTEVDNRWLMNEIKATNPNNQVEPLSVSLLKHKAKTIFSEEFLSTQFEMETTPTFTGKLAVESMLQGGKRMRPLLALIAYSAYANPFESRLADQLMLVVECFHKASLIHDDIEDHDDYRYNQKTAHHKNGIPQAINLGDFLIGQGYLKMSQLPITPIQKAELLQLFASMHVESTLGQGEELRLFEKQLVAEKETMLHLFRQKTGSAIQVSLLAGAITANAPESDQQCLITFSDLFGMAYQIRDDLSEFQGVATDQKSASYPFLKSLLIEKTTLHVTTEDQWKIEITKHQIDKKAQHELDAILLQIKTILNQLESHKLRLALLGVVNHIFKSR